MLLLSKCNLHWNQHKSKFCTYRVAKCVDVQAMLAYRRQYPPTEINDLLNLAEAERVAKVGHAGTDDFCTLVAPRDP